MGAPSAWSALEDSSVGSCRAIWGLYAQAELWVCVLAPVLRRQFASGAAGGGCLHVLGLHCLCLACFDELRGSFDWEGFDAGEVVARHVGVLLPSLRSSLGAVGSADCLARSGVASAVDADGQFLGLGAVPPSGLLECFIGPRDILASTGDGGLGFGALMRNASGPRFESVASRGGPSAGVGHAAPPVHCCPVGVVGLRLSGVNSRLGKRLAGCDSASAGIQLCPAKQLRTGGINAER